MPSASPNPKQSSPNPKPCTKKPYDSVIEPGFEADALGSELTLTTYSLILVVTHFLCACFLIYQIVIILLHYERSAFLKSQHSEN